MGPDADFRLHWGEHNGKPLDAILDEDPSYFEHLVGQRCNILDVYPELRLALNARNGLADDLERRRPALMRKTAEVLMQKGDPNRGGADNGRAEIQKLRRLQKARGVSYHEAAGRRRGCPTHCSQGACQE